MGSHLARPSLAFGPTVVASGPTLAAFGPTKDNYQSSITYPESVTSDTFAPLSNPFKSPFNQSDNPHSFGYTTVENLRSLRITLQHRQQINIIEWRMEQLTC